MGNQCCQDDHINQGFSDHRNSMWGGEVQMEDYFDQTLQDNYNLPANMDARPVGAYGTRVNRRPKLFHLVQDSLSRQFQSRGRLKNDGLMGGVNLPVHYIQQHHGYYQGAWRRGKPTGLGRLYFQNGSVYQGPFMDGRIQGQDGIYVYPDGSYKRGKIINGMLQGFGRFVSRSGNFMYQGQWLNDQPHGRGVEVYPDGSRYQGDFVNGKKNSTRAVYRWANGKVYTGPFKEGYMEGIGKLEMSSRKGFYQGQFYRNLKVGRGKMVTQTGTYQGPFQNGQMHGIGTFTWNDGKRYQGSFERGELHGPGTMSYPNGQVVRGIWHRGENLQVQKIDSDRNSVRM